MIDLKVYHRDVLEFYNFMDWPVNHDFKQLQHMEANRRAKFIREELSELLEATTLADTIDALVDVGYIAIGNLLHCGHALNYVPKGEYNTKEFAIKGILHDQVLVRPLSHIEVMEALVGNKLSALFDDMYSGLVFALEDAPILAAAQSCAIIIRAANIASCLGLNYWDHWRLVHEANMRKVPASADNPSSRGYTEGDAVKPEGWVEPDHQSIIDTRNIPYDFDCTSRTQ